MKKIKTKTYVHETYMFGFIGFADKNNINIGQDVWLKKKCDVSFFPEICTRSA